MPHPFLINYARLLELQNIHTDTILLDVRTANEYWRGHLQGARHFDALLFSHYDTSASGIATIVNQYEWIFSALGISKDSHVVVVDNQSDARAARAGWLLELLGHERVSILDGGLKLLGNVPLETHAAPFVPTPFKAALNAHVVIGVDELASRLHEPGFRPLDTRRAAEYFGEEKRAKRTGSIPGAIHRDYAENIAVDGRFVDGDTVRGAYTAQGIDHDDEIVTFCGGGARAAHSYYALKAAGYPRVRVYTGSWGEWGNNDDLPVDQPARAT